jgi:hypothetical protein
MKHLRRLIAPGCDGSPSKADELTVVCLGCGHAMAPRAGLPVCSNRCAQREWPHLARLNPKGDELASRSAGAAQTARPRPLLGRKTLVEISAGLVVPSQ